WRPFVGQKCKSSGLRGGASHDPHFGGAGNGSDLVDIRELSSHRTRVGLRHAGHPSPVGRSCQSGRCRGSRRLRGQGYLESAVIVDISGVDQAALRGDGAGIHTPESADDKAYTSVSLGVDTQGLYDTQRNQISTTGPFSKVQHLVLFGGGVVIKLGAET